MVDTFCLHCHYLHMDQRKILPSPWASPQGETGFTIPMGMMLWAPDMDMPRLTHTHRAFHSVTLSLTHSTHSHRATSVAYKQAWWNAGGEFAQRHRTVRWLWDITARFWDVACSGGKTLSSVWEVDSWMEYVRVSWGNMYKLKKHAQKPILSFLNASGWKNIIYSIVAGKNRQKTVCP